MLLPVYCRILKIEDTLEAVLDGDNLLDRLSIEEQVST